jgi:hypothetical protein
MKTLLLTAMILCGLIGSVVGQKKSSFLGDTVIGEVAGADEATREITIKYPGKEGTEVFSGILEDGYQLKLHDGSRRELKIIEITSGIRVRAFYKSDHQNVSGNKQKINKIFRLDFLGKDEYVRLRDQLSIHPSTVVASTEMDGLPSTYPLKVYLSSAYSDVQKRLVDWLNKWNQKHVDASQKLELVSDLEQADILIVIARGSDTMVAVLPMEVYKDNRLIKGEWSQATSYVVVKEREGLKVLWTRVAPVLSVQKVEVSPKSTESIISEMEKRMKVRSGKSKK